jgi:hypothetical protein
MLISKVFENGMLAQMKIERRQRDLTMAIMILLRKNIREERLSHA